MRKSAQMSRVPSAVAEWPLVVFTLALQLSCGLTLASAIGCVTAQEEAAPGRLLAVAVFPVLAVGILASLLHLGRPISAWKSLRNVRQSPVSREVLLTALFALLALLYAGSWSFGTAGIRPALGVTASGLGFAAVLSSAAVYRLPSQPVWNSNWLALSFVGDSMLLGGLAGALVPRWPQDGGVLRPLLGLTIAGSIVVFLSACWMAACVSRMHGRFAPLLGPMGTRHYVFLALHVFLACLLPVGLVLRFWPVVPLLGTPVGLGLFASVLLGAALGRTLLYSSTQKAQLRTD